jgi:NAD(P)-dependent dehydrogenase (short-subunit alcohol dehydrogenase family)
MKQLQNKVAIVTGASKGIGLAITGKLADQGAIVYAFDLLQNADYPEGVFFIRCDVADEENWRSAVQHVLKERSRIDILVNNAGIISYTPIHEIQLEEWNRLIAVDQTGVLLGMKHVIPQMMEQQQGSIINVSSIWGSVGAANVVAYNAAKGAVVLMTKNAAITYAKKGIRVNSVHPGFIHTPLTDNQDEALNRIVIAATPMGRGGMPDEVANGVVFLASEQASFITGSELVIDGGYTAQ